MSPLSVHAGVEGFGEGGQVEAEFTSMYVNIARAEYEDAGAVEDTERSTVPWRVLRGADWLDCYSTYDDGRAEEEQEGEEGRMRGLRRKCLDDLTVGSVCMSLGDSI